MKRVALLLTIFLLPALSYGASPCGLSRCQVAVTASDVAVPLAKSEDGLQEFIISKRIPETPYVLFTSLTTAQLRSLRAGKKMVVDLNGFAGIAANGPIAAEVSGPLSATLAAAEGTVRGSMLAKGFAPTTNGDLVGAGISYSLHDSESAMSSATAAASCGFWGCAGGSSCSLWRLQNGRPVELAGDCTWGSWFSCHCVTWDGQTQ